MTMLEDIGIKEDFFKNKKTLKAEDLDYQFNLVTNYLNTKVSSALKTISMQTQKITDNSKAGYFYHSSDDNFSWKGITKDDIPDQSITLNRLVKNTPCSVLFTDERGVIRSRAPVLDFWGSSFDSSEEQHVLCQKKNNDLDWALLTSANILDYTITHDKFSLSSFAAEKFKKGVLDLFKLEDSSINGALLNPEKVSIQQNQIDNEVINDLRYFEHGAENPKIFYLKNKTNKIEFHGGLFFDRVLTHERLDKQANLTNPIICVDSTKISDKFIIDSESYKKSQPPFQKKNFKNGLINASHIKPNSLHGKRLEVNKSMLKGLLKLEHLKSGG